LSSFISADRVNASVADGESIFNIEISNHYTTEAHDDVEIPSGAGVLS